MGARCVIVGFAASIFLSAPLAAQTTEPSGTTQAPAQNAAEIAFWTSVKDSKNPAELRAYLAAFPNGLFTQLARLRIADLEKSQQAQPAPPAAPPPAPSQQPAAAANFSSPDIIREIQVKLYELNYDPGRIDGVMTPATRTAIREWQEIAKLPVSGSLDEAQLKHLRDTRVSSTWAAIAYTARGGNGAVFNQPSRAAAEQAATDLCLKRAGRGAKCSAIAGSGSTCLTMASYTTKRGRTTYFGSHVALRPNQTASISEALRRCNEAENSGNNCAARVTICADGSHRK